MTYPFSSCNDITRHIHLNDYFPTLLKLDVSYAIPVAVVMLSINRFRFVAHALKTL